MLSILVVAICLFLTGFTTCYLWPKFNKLKTKAIKKKYHPVYEMINLRHGFYTMLWPIMFLVRRILFVIAVCGVYNVVAIQLLMFMLPTMAVMMILALVKPLADLPTNRLEIYNSFSLLMMTYCIMCFTPFALDAEARYTMGYVMVILTVLNIGVNIYVIGKQPARMCKLKCKNRWRRRGKITRSFSLKAQKTKNFLKRAFTRKTAADDDRSINDDFSQICGKLSDSPALDTISEEDSQDDSLDSDQAIQKELKKVGIEGVRTKHRSQQVIVDEYIDQLNAKAVELLE